MPHNTLYDRFDRAFTAADGRAAFRAADGQVLLTYQDLRAAVSRYANALQALGVEAGDRRFFQGASGSLSVARTKEV